MGWKALAPPVLGWHQLGWANRERSNGRDFYSSACSDLLRGGRWRLKALDAGAGENENDNDPAFLTARRREYSPHTPHRYLVAARAAHRSQRGRSAVRVRSPYSRCPKNSIEQPTCRSCAMPFRFISKSIHTYLIDYPLAIVLVVAPFRLKLGNGSPVALWLSPVTRVTT